MSVRVSDAVWKRSRQRGTALNVLLALADYADDQGRSWPSVGSLAKKSRLTTRQTQKILRQLEADAEIVIEYGAGPSRCNRYTLSVATGCHEGQDVAGDSVPKNRVSPATGCHGGSGTPSPTTGGGCHPGSPDPVLSDTQPVIDPSREPSRTRQGEPRANNPAARSQQSRTTRRRKTYPPEQMEITDKMREWAATEGFGPKTIAEETVKMLDYFRAKGEQRADWPATWRNWLRRTREFGGQNAQRKGNYHSAAEREEANRRALEEQLARG